MAVVTRRYMFKGPCAMILMLATDPTLSLPPGQFVITYDVTYDDAVASQAAMDAQMMRSGCYPDTQNTIVLAPSPFLGLIAPNNAIWRLSVDNLGILSTDKVT